MGCRLYVPPGSLRAGTHEITGDDHHYLFRVRRLKVGDEVVLFDGTGHEADAAVTLIGRDQAALEVREPRAAARSDKPRTVVLPALIKGDRLDWSVPKLVELGADEIIPVETARSVVRLLADPERAESRRRRFESRAQVAARQCRSAIVPAIAPITDLEGALAATADVELKLLFWEGASAVPLRQALPARDQEAPPASIALLTGPEGGFSDDEVARAEDSGFLAVGLGPRVLRAETAAVAALAIVGFALGDLG